MTKPLCVYVAGRFGRQGELSGYADDLEDHGLVCTSRWLRGDHGWTTNEAEDFTSPQLRQFAQEDLEDIDDADVLVVFTEDASAGYLSGGRHVEYGYALAKGKRLVIVGGPENVFHHGEDTVPDWDEARALLVRMALGGDA